MNLSVKERLILLQILPRESNFATLKVLRQLKDDVGFTEKEHKKLKFMTMPGDKAKGIDAYTSWDDAGEKKVGEVDIKIGEKAAEIVAESLKKLDEGKKLREEHYSLYEKFVEVKSE